MTERVTDIQKVFSHIKQHENEKKAYAKTKKEIIDSAYESLVTHIKDKEDKKLAIKAHKHAYMIWDMGEVDRIKYEESIENCEKQLSMKF